MLFKRKLYFFSILRVPNARSRSSATAITRRRASPTARPTTTSCSETCASSATKSLVEMVSVPLTPEKAQRRSTTMRRHFSVHRHEQSVVRAPLRLLRVRPEDEPEDQVLRVRPQARLQEVLREVPGRVPAPLEAPARSHWLQETGRIKLPISESCSAINRKLFKKSKTR